MAKLGTDGPARHCALLSSAWWTGPPPIPRRGPPRATNRMTRPPRRSPRRKLLAVSGSEPGVNASPLFKEPAARITQYDGWACSRVGWTIPATHAKTDSLRIEHPIRTLTYCALVTRRSNRDLCLSCQRRRAPRLVLAVREDHDPARGRERAGGLPETDSPLWAPSGTSFATSKLIAPVGTSNANQARSATARRGGSVQVSGRERG